MSAKNAFAIAVKIAVKHVIIVLLKVLNPLI
jgi:hypothetical protein